MAKPYSVSGLRADLYRVLDRVLETGVPVEIERRGKRLRIVPADDVGPLHRITPEDDYICGDPESLVHLDWSGEWKP
jgi:antitoxin (DNA-binding transcriptional repressor) of toxin-antitoxin stability system